MKLPSIVRDVTREGESLRSVMLRGAGGSLAVRASAGILGLASSLVLTRTLGAEGFGAYSWAFACVSALTLATTLGLDTLLIREASVMRQRAAWGALRGLLRRSDRASLGVALALGGAAAIAAAAVGGRLPDHLLVALAALPLFTLAVLRQGALQGVQRPATGLAVTTLLRQLPFLALLGAALLVGGGDFGSLTAVALQVAAGAVALTGAFLLMRRALPRDARPAREEEPPTAWLRQSLPMGLSSGLATFNSQLPLIALGVLAGEAEAGLYAAAVSLTALFSMLLLAGRAPWAPIAARLWVAGEHDRLRRGLTLSTRWIGGISLAMAVVLGVLAEPAMSLFGSEFEDGAAALRFLLVANAVNAFAAYNGNTLLMCGQQWAAARAGVGATIVDVALIAALIPALDVEGAALAMLGSTVYRNAVNSWQSWRLLGIDTTMVGLRPRAARTGAGSPPGSG